MHNNEFYCYLFSTFLKRLELIKKIFKDLATKNILAKFNIILQSTNIVIHREKYQ